VQALPAWTGGCDYPKRGDKRGDLSDWQRRSAWPKRHTPQSLAAGDLEPRFIVIISSLRADRGTDRDAWPCAASPGGLGSCGRGSANEERARSVGGLCICPLGLKTIGMRYQTHHYIWDPCREGTLLVHNVLSV
jgi:hypothetical protein